MKTPYIKSIYTAMQHLADITKNCIVQRNFKQAKKCFGIADRLLRTGGAQVRNAVENVYLYSVTIWLEGNMNWDAQNQILSLMPASLQAEYYLQVNTTGD